MKYDDLHGHKQKCDTQLQMDEGNNCTQYRRQLPLRTGKPLIPKISAATAAAESHKLCERMATGSISKIAARQHIHTSQPLHCRPLNLSIPHVASATTVRNAGGCIPVNQHKKQHSRSHQLMVFASGSSAQQKNLSTANESGSQQRRKSDVQSRYRH